MDTMDVWGIKWITYGVASGCPPPPTPDRQPELFRNLCIRSRQWLRQRRQWGGGAGRHSARLSVPDPERRRQRLPKPLRPPVPVPAPAPVCQHRPLPHGQPLGRQGWGLPPPTLGTCPLLCLNQVVLDQLTIVVVLDIMAMSVTAMSLTLSVKLIVKLPCAVTDKLP